MFEDDVVLTTIREKCIPVTIDQFYTRRQSDKEGEYYWSIVKQRGYEKGKTTQGFYLVSPSGKLLYSKSAGLNQWQLPTFKKELVDVLDTFAPSTAEVMPKLTVPTPDLKTTPRFPAGAVIARVHAKAIAQTDSPVSQDFLWLTADEQKRLLDNTLTDEIKYRLLRYHFIDNTLGEPKRWKKQDIISESLTLVDGKLSGSFVLKSEKNQAGYTAHVLGHIRGDDQGRITQLKMVAEGSYYGNTNIAGIREPGEFPLAVSFRLDPEAPTGVLPQGMKGWPPSYWNPLL